MTNPYDMGAYPYGWGMSYPSFSPIYPMTPEGEKEWLKSQGESIQQQIDQINSRIVELEKE
jgi:hypothetical protein